MPEQSGQTGLTLWLRKTSDGTLVNTGGDVLSESPASSGRFTATVAESWTETLAASVRNASSLTVRDGWLADGETLVRDAYPSTGGGSGGAGDASQETVQEVLDVANSIATALAGGSPVEPTGVTIREQLNLIQSNTASLSSLTASLPIKTGIIVGPSEPLVIGDDYTSAVGRQVRVNLLNSTGGSAATTFGSKSLSDAGISIQLLLRKSGQPSAVAQLVGICSFFPAVTVDGVEIPPYLLVNFSRTETAKATPGAYDMQAEAVWSSNEVVTFAPYGQIEFVRNIIRPG
jgi:hypothetical protein